MVILRCERFVIEKKIADKKVEYSSDYDYNCIHVTRLVYSLVIYDRVAKKEIILIDTGNHDLDKELAEALLTMLNIKYVGKEEEE